MSPQSCRIHATRRLVPQGNTMLVKLSNSTTHK